MDLGYLIATFSAGRLISHLPYGYFSGIIRHRLTLLMSGFIFTIGTILWAYTKLKPSLMLFYWAQFLLGVGTGSMGTARTYVMEMTEEGIERTDQLAHVLSWKFIGLAATPFLSSLSVIFGGLLIDRSADYTFPAFLLFLLGLSWIFLLIYPFKNVEETQTGRRLIEESRLKVFEAPPLRSSDEESAPLMKKGPSSYQTMSEEGSQQRKESHEHPPKGREIGHTGITTDVAHVLIIVIILNCLIKGTIAIYETHITRLLIDYFYWDQYHVGMLVSASGVIGALQLINFHSLYTLHWSSYELMYASALSIIGIHVLLIITNFSVLSSPVNLKSQANRGESLQEIVLMLSVLVMYGFGYPIASTAVSAKYSNLLEYGKQGVIQAMMSLSSSFSRIVASIASSYIVYYRYYYYGSEDRYYQIHNQVLAGSVLFLTTAFLLLLILYREKILTYGPDRQKMRGGVDEMVNKHVNRGVSVVAVTVFAISVYTMFF